MYGGETTHQILKYLREGKTQRDIARLVNRHPNTITNHVKWLRKHQIYKDEETLNKIDDRLSNEINKMSVPSLLSWRSQLVPKRIETKGELTVKKEVPTLDIHKFNDDEVAEIRRVARRIHASRDAGEE